MAARSNETRRGGGAEGSWGHLHHGWLDDGVVDFELQVEEALNGGDRCGWVRPSCSSSSRRTRPVATINNKHVKRTVLFNIRCNNNMFPLN